jgi:hypothetical protein
MGFSYAHNLLSNVLKEAFNSHGMNTNPSSLFVCYTFQVASMLFKWTWQLLLFVYEVLIQRVKNWNNKQWTSVAYKMRGIVIRLQVSLIGKGTVYYIIDFSATIFCFGIFLRSNFTLVGSLQIFVIKIGNFWCYSETSSMMEIWLIRDDI